jgi:hypothetical protein
VFAIGWPSESDECAAVSPRRSRAHAALRNACGCDDVAATRSGVSRTGMGVARLQGFYRLIVLMRLKYRDRRALLWYFNRIKTTINRIKTTINRIKQTSKAVGV